jgi:Putative DNA-binding domain
VQTQIVANQASPDEWNLDRLRLVVSEHDLERARIEYKRELGNGNPTLEAIAALANTFGGVILVGVDETKTGLDRLTGVDASERDRLSRMCWDKLVPPFDPEIVPIKLGDTGKFALVIIVDPEDVRRPVMLTQGNKIPVRIEGHNVPADWYRLRGLFTEQSAGVSRPSLRPANKPYTVKAGDHPGGFAADLGPDLYMRGRLLLAGPRSRPLRITDSVRKEILAALNNDLSPLTGTHSILAHLMSSWARGTWNYTKWELEGRADTRVASARWYGVTSNGKYLTQARFTAKLKQKPAAAASLLISLETLLTNPLSPSMEEILGSFKSDREDSNKPRRGPKWEPAPFLDLRGVRGIMLATIATLWGPVSTVASTTILTQPLGPPAQLAMTISTVNRKDSPTELLSKHISFGKAQLIPRNTPTSCTAFPIAQANHELFNYAAQEQLADDWLAYLAIDNGYQNIDQEIARLSSTGPTT